MSSQSVLLSVTWNTISLSFRHVSYRKKPDWNQVPPSCVNVRQVIEPLKPLPIHVRELKTEVLPRDVVKSRTVENGPSASHLDCRCRVRYTSTGIPCWGRCPHRRGAGWPHTPATSGCGGGGGANTLKTSTSPSRKGPKIAASLLTAGLHVLEKGGL